MRMQFLYQLRLCPRGKATVTLPGYKTYFVPIAKDDIIMHEGKMFRVTEIIHDDEVMDSIPMVVARE